MPPKGFPHYWNNGDGITLLTYTRWETSRCAGKRAVRLVFPAKALPAVKSLVKVKFGDAQNAGDLFLKGWSLQSCSPFFRVLLCTAISITFDAKNASFRHIVTEDDKASKLLVTKFFSPKIIWLFVLTAKSLYITGRIPHFQQSFQHMPLPMWKLKNY